MFSLSSFYLLKFYYTIPLSSHFQTSPSILIFSSLSFKTASSDESILSITNPLTLESSKKNKILPSIFDEQHLNQSKLQAIDQIPTYQIYLASIHSTRSVRLQPWSTNSVMDNWFKDLKSNSKLIWSKCIIIYNTRLLVWFKAFAIVTDLV